MPVYFIVDVYVGEDRGAYDRYVELVKPVVESYGGVYLARTENVHSFGNSRRPDRVILVRFPNAEALQECFSSPEYQAIVSLRTESVESRAIAVEGLD